VAQPAFANGSKTTNCSLATTVHGLSGTAAATTTQGDLWCGSVGARDWYKYPSSSTTYYTAWKYGSASISAINPTGAIGLGGHHTVTVPAYWYTQNFPFST